MVSSDGRRQRSERSRAAIVDAVLGFLREGETSPSSSEIADRAGVTQRTIFNHFTDMEALMFAVVRKHAEHILPLVPPADASGPVCERIDRYCSAIAAIAEESQNIRWAAVTHPTGTRYSLGVQYMRELLRERLLATFPAELDALPPVQRDRVLALLEVEIDPLVWRIRRVQNHQSYDEALAAMRHVFELALSSPSLRA